MPPEARAGRRSALWLIPAGGLQALCFAPGPLPAWMLPFVQIAALAVLAWHTWRARSARQAAWAGWLFGTTQFAVGVYWLTISMHRYGGLALPLAIAALLLFAATVALYIAAACALTRWLCGPWMPPHQRAAWQMLSAATWAASWTLFEWLRGTLFTGFTWLDLGYAHTEGMLAAWAPFVGVYGVGWLSAFAAAAAALMILARDTPYDRSAAAVVAAAVVSGLLGIAWGHIQWARPSADPVMVRLVQPNIPLEEKFAAGQLERSQAQAQYLAALDPKTPDSAPRLIILPETVVPLFQDAVPEPIWDQWQAVATRRQATILLGVPLHTRRAGVDRYTNGALALFPETAAATPPPPWHYDKHHLVPFGEFIPPGFHFFVHALNIPLGDFDRGPLRQAPLQVAGQHFAVDICYEDAFGEEIAANVAPHEHGPGANVLVNISNLAWFGNSWALRQHLQIARMRALETARPFLQVSNTGITAAIDPSGHVLDQLDPERPGVIDVQIQGAQGLTPYVRWGNAPILAFTVLVLLLAFGRRRRGA